MERAQRDIPSSKMHLPISSNEMGFLTNLSRTLACPKMSLIAIAVTVISQIFMIVRWANGIQGLEVFYCLPWAIGCGLFFSPQFLALTICSPKEQIASATAVYYLSQQVGHVSGTSTSTALLQQIFRFRLDISLDNIPVTQRNMVSLAPMASLFWYANTSFS